MNTTNHKPQTTPRRLIGTGNLSYFKFIAMLALLFTSYSLQAQGHMRVRNDGHSQIGYNAQLYGLNNTHKCLTFGNAGLTPNNGQWGMCYLFKSLNFFRMNANNAADIDLLTISDAGIVGINCNYVNSFSLKPASVRLAINGLGVSNGFGVFSDSRLKDNVTNLDSTVLTKLLALNAVSYHNKIGTEISGTSMDSMIYDSAYISHKNAQTANPYTDSVLHFGLIAQEVKTIFPNLIMEMESSLLALNYTELIPILIKAIQDQQKQIEDQKAQILLIKNLTPSSTTKSVLYQNDPNPFDANTTFRYYIDETISVSNCSIEVRDLTGVLKSTVTLADQSGIGQTTYNGGALNPGYYVYTLKVNGAAKDSKMLLIER